MSKGLKAKLTEYTGEDFYPYHMPGHKRRDFFDFPQNIAALDITEIDGFDNLHAPSGVLCDVENRLARVYSADESHMLINGSTAGVLSAISACMSGAEGKCGSALIMGRNSHKSAYNAAYICDTPVTYLQESESFLINSEDVEKSLLNEEAMGRRVGCVFITSPTYEGVVQDVESIAKLCHVHHVPLIVDAAHGAHLGFSEGFAENPLKLGADICIMSLHKTLPSLTQTAVVHLKGERVDRRRLGRFLRIYQSSSPSYILMASIDECTAFLEGESVRRPNLFDEFADRYKGFLSRVKGLKNIYAGGFLEGADGKKCDIGKCIIRDKNGVLSGKKIYDILRSEFMLQPEMAGKEYCLSMFTVMDEDEAYDRMYGALGEIDVNYDKYAGKSKAERSDGQDEGAEIKVYVLKDEYVNSEKGKQKGIRAAWDAECEILDIGMAAGRISAEFVSMYPPGTPIVVPGEIYDEERIGLIADSVKKGLNVQGIEISRDL